MTKFDVFSQIISEASQIKDSEKLTNLVKKLFGRKPGMDKEITTEEAEELLVMRFCGCVAWPGRIWKRRGPCVIQSELGGASYEVS